MHPRSQAPRLLVLVTLLGVLVGLPPACGFDEYSFDPDAGSRSAAGTSGVAGRSFTDGSVVGTGGGGRGGAGIGGSGGGTPAGGGGATAGGAGGLTPAGGQPPDASTPTGCVADADCIGATTGDACDTATGQCVRCLPNDDRCGPGLYCTGANVCALGCDDDLDCASQGSRQPPAADAGPGLDASADGAADSGDAAPIDADAADDASAQPPDAAAGPLTCDLSSHRCVGCRSDTDCSLGTVCEGGQCVTGCGPQRDCPSGFACCGSDCADLETSVSHCGACDATCAPPGATPTCAAGACGFSTCLPRFSDCNGSAADGCESPSETDPANCGACGNACPRLPNASGACVRSRCSAGACDDGYADCNGNPADGCEINTQIDENNCSSCGFLCDLLNANERCDAGACAIATCEAGFADCDGNPANGCEVNTATSVGNCGGCGAVCSFASAGARCTNGVCEIGACVAPGADCDGNTANGCEVNTATSLGNCGGCGLACSLPNATAACTGGTCSIQSCNAGFGDCNGLASDGCETNLETSTTHCGGCGLGCSGNNGAATCALGACQISCFPGYSNCDTNLGNGCEVNVTSSILHCGTCANECTATGGTPNCVNGACGISQCQGSLADCDGSAANGCEVNVTGDVRNCGGCGLACFVANGTAGCTGGNCFISACDAAFDDCNGFPQDGCEARLNTLINCGTCGQACVLPNANASCTSGACTIASCIPPFANCDGNPANGCEVDTSRRNDHCGSCGNVCNGTNGSAACNAGTCEITCAAGFGNCNASASDGCETALTNNPAACGSCGNVCAVQNGQPTCLGNTCSILSCTAPYADCDLQYSTGCEISTTTNGLHCGACGQACNSTNGSPTCTSAACQIACNGGYGNCDGNAANGCEVNLQTTRQHCGSCGNACSYPNATAVCDTGACQLGSCSAGFANCNGSALDGCEANLNSSVANCGTCGVACTLANAVAACSGGVCQIASCVAPFADCDGNPANGCEVDTSQSVSHCGGCGAACSTQNGTPTCTAGACSIGCFAGFSDCDASLGNGCEINTAASVSNCGSCGNACPATGGTPNCTSGVCGLAACNVGRGDCDGSSANGCEVDLTRDPLNCATCGNVCQAANATSICTASACAIEACSPGYADCNGLYADGCETNLATVLNCGSCGQACALANATATCTAGLCEIASCTAPFADCDGLDANGCEVDTNTSVASCGACGASCSAVNGTPSCSGGSCLVACNGGYGDCDANVANGCESATTNNVSHCGACGNTCSAPNGTPACIGTQCGIGSCTAPFADCNQALSDGCETNTGTSLAHCGACGSVCDGTNGSASCSAGACTVTCNAGFANCDGSVANGCEVNLGSSVTSCGSCGNVCSFANATPVCSAGTCGIGACTAGFASCDGNATSGCETDVTTTSNCGACGNTCTNANGTTRCETGACVPTCAANFADCNGNPADGCETDLRTTSNCGTCGQLCSIPNAVESCATGTCTLSSCDPGHGNCDANAANGCETPTSGDTSNCGGCGTVCASINGTATCSGGTCGITCSSGFRNCDGNATNGCEINSNQDVGNCGSCGNACSFTNATATCFGGTCQLDQCAPGYASCDGNATNGCETSLTTLSSCGVCGQVCALANAAESCGSGTCTLGACDAGFANCDGTPGNGCEVNTQTSVQSCGACGNVCSTVNATASCSLGACSVACNAGFDDCDGSAGNGCERSLSTTSNCGACGNACTNANGSTACVGQTCTPTCAAGFGDCNGNPNDGCEANRQTSVTHCGACGNACTNDNGTTSCVGGACVPACGPGFGNCNGNPNDGCETSTSAAIANCGACGNVCTNANGTTACVGGTCTPVCNTGYRDCDGNAANGCETPTGTDISNCGTCGNVCPATGGSPTCTAGVCGISTCGTTMGDCDGNTANGCETPLNTLTDCGSCSATCNLANASETCSTGTCLLSLCDSGFGNCDNAAANGCEVPISSDIANCGTCGNVCSATNGTPSCALGACAIGCSSGYGNCDGNLANGCETSLTGLLNCGACGNTCSNANGGTSCTGGLCVPSCNSGYADCDGNPNNGCETDLNNSASSCGACGVSCSNSNGSTVCAGGVCSPSCSAGYRSCDSNPNNGCETPITTVANCGNCGIACVNANGTTACTAGVCVPSCAPGYADCDGDPNNGCETSTQTNASNCGGCGTVCNATNGSAYCSLGACSITCSSGFGNCDGSAANGCELPLTTTTNCGACGQACSNTHGSSTCTSGACSPTCDAGWSDCDSNPNNGCERDVNTLSDCGACNALCALVNATESCNLGVCTLGLCSAGWENCDGVVGNGCEAQIGSLSHCGGCNIACTNANGSTVCSGGLLCSPTCNAGFASCDSNANNGCETNTQASVTHCGACGNACAFPNAGASCSTGACLLGSCSAGFGNCDGTAANGCETPLTNVTNCGACGTACTNANGTTACSAGACAPACNAGFASCDSNANNGCETNTQTSVTHCGACGTGCTNPNGPTSCVSGACSPTCNAGFGNCDANTRNGCETNTQTSSTNCGACGTTCTNANGTTSCASSLCAPVCASGFASCDGNATNGCEQNIDSNLANCGACGAVCGSANASPSCSLGACQLNCNPGFADCDGNKANGCEVNVNTSKTHCGTCNNACASGGSCGTVTPGVCDPPCQNGVKGGAETDIDCGGGTCPACGTNKLCSNNNANCTSKRCVSTSCGFLCSEYRCAAPSCTDGVKNGIETDVDCGGSCSSCADGKACAIGADCLNGVCTGGVCQAPSCSDGVRNGTEGDVDCGTACGNTCAEGQTCIVPGDCAGTYCVQGLCDALACFNTVKDHVETDVDCGGEDCAGCGTDKLCKVNNDCSSLRCTNRGCSGWQCTDVYRCAAPTCSDGVKNQGEVGVDCRGPCAALCPVGQTCGVAGDCITNVCTGGVCVGLAPGAACTSDGQCTSGVCAASVCRTPPVANCYGGQYGGHAYYYCPTALTRAAARTSCTNAGMDLARIDDAAENTYVNARSTNSFWIGFNDLTTEGTWVWADGTAGSYTSWNSGEPNDSGGAEDCAELVNTGLWNDTDCAGTRTYVCEDATP